MLPGRNASRACRHRCPAAEASIVFALPAPARVFALLIAALPVAACTSGPRYPLYSPVQATGSFGFSEEPLANDRFRIAYRAPIRRGYELSRAEAERLAEQSIELSYDLALMRASELTLSQGAYSFDIADRQNEVEADVGIRYVPYYDPLPHWHWRRHPYRYPHGLGLPPYGPIGYPEQHSEIAVSVSFVMTLRRAPGSGAFDAQSTLHRLRAKYPQAGTVTGT